MYDLSEKVFIGVTVNEENLSAAGEE